MSSTSRLAGALDEIHDVDLDAMTDTELEEHTLSLGRELARGHADHARAIAKIASRRSWAADGSKSCAAWLARKTNGCRSTASAAVRFGESLEQMPLVAVALHAGEITVEHARLLASCRRFKPDRFPEAEETLLGHAKSLRFQAFVIVCARWRDVVDPDGTEDRAAKLHDRRHLIFRRRPDGSLEIQSGLLDPIGAEAFLNELERIERDLFRQDWAAAMTRSGDAPTLGDLGRTQPQRWADALVEMAYRSRTAPKDGKRPAPLVSVYVDYETVFGRLCELASGVPITPGQLLPIFTQADIERIVFGPRNRVIELGVRERFFTGGLRRAIQLRDRHCQFPGCTEPVDRCEVDHDIDHADGGETTQENGKLLCGTHNRNKRKYESAVIDLADADLDLDQLDDDDPPETDEQIDRQIRRCRARVNKLIEAKRKPWYSRSRPPPARARTNV